MSVLNTEALSPSCYETADAYQRYATEMVKVKTFHRTLVPFQKAADGLVPLPACGR